jgi:hypothetical protein
MSMLPEVRDCSANYGETDKEIFGAAIPIRGIAGDQQAATIGQACFVPGMLKSTYGTGCFALLNTGADMVLSKNRLLSTIAYRLAGKTVYALEGSIFIAGAAVQWLRDGLGIVDAAYRTGDLAMQADATQQVYLVDRPESKRGAVVRLIKRLKLQQVIVFTNTKIGASRLARELQKEGISADAIHGDKSQGERLITLERFKRGEVLVLVATDVAARGLDIAELPAVINYDVPYAAEDYVHRIGRTGRAGASGQAISVMSPVDERLMQDIEKLIGKKLVREKLPGLDMPPGADPLFFLPYEDDSSPAASSAKAAAPAQSPLLTGSAKRLVGAAVLLGGKPRLTGQ